MNEQPYLQSGFAPFVPRARLLRLIGSELISDDVVAITELVKNAHDADATFVSIQFVNVRDGAGEIIIRDDGHGMDLDTLLQRWMQPAGSAKGRESTRFTPGGRRVLGEKGVGRFATDKLASRLELVSRRRGDLTEIHASFDWDEFDVDDRMLADVKNRWEVRAPDWLDSHGTMLRLTGLRSQWNERMFRRLCTRLARLVSPFDTRKGFRIIVESDEFPQYSGEVDGGYLSVAPYKLEATFDGDRSISVRINDRKPVRHELSAEERPVCGPVNARLFAFDLETEALSKLGPRTEVRAWLREWSGLSVYRDGFRVWPYGEPHDDWLRLDQRRVNNPVVRLSNNQVVGFLEIGSDRNPELRDQTNREGLIHNDAFESLQRFVLFTMQLLEAERQSFRHPQSKRSDRSGSTSRSGQSAAALADTLDSIARNAEGPIAEHLARAASRTRAAQVTDQQERRKLIEGYAELAAVGQTASFVGRSISASLDRIQIACASLRRVSGKKKLDAVVQSAAALSVLEEAVHAASEQLGALSAMQTATSRRRRGIDVAAELRRFEELGRPLMQDHGAAFRVEAAQGSVLRTEMRPELFGAVISSFVTNAIEWRHGSRPVVITFSVHVRGDVLEIVVSDTGRGVTPGLEETIFEPMVSGREDGTGMGLTITRSIVEAHGGRIALVADGRRKGASFRITLPRKKARSTNPAGHRRGT